MDVCVCVCVISFLLIIITGKHRDIVIMFCIQSRWQKQNACLSYLNNLARKSLRAASHRVGARLIINKRDSNLRGNILLKYRCCKFYTHTHTADNFPADTKKTAINFICDVCSFYLETFARAHANRARRARSSWFLFRFSLFFLAITRCTRSSASELTTTAVYQSRKIRNYSRARSHVVLFSPRSICETCGKRATWTFAIITTWDNQQCGNFFTIPSIARSKWTEWIFLFTSYSIIRKFSMPPHWRSVRFAKSYIQIFMLHLPWRVFGKFVDMYKYFVATILF